MTPFSFFSLFSLTLSLCLSLSLFVQSELTGIPAGRGSSGASGLLLQAGSAAGPAASSTTAVNGGALESIVALDACSTLSPSDPAAEGKQVGKIQTHKQIHPSTTLTPHLLLLLFRLFFLLFIYSYRSKGSVYSFPAYKLNYNCAGSWSLLNAGARRGSLSSIQHSRRENPSCKQGIDALVYICRNSYLYMRLLICVQTRREGRRPAGVGSRKKYSVFTRGSYYDRCTVRAQNFFPSPSFSLSPPLLERFVRAIQISFCFSSLCAPIQIT